MMAGEHVQSIDVIMPTMKDLAYSPGDHDVPSLGVQIAELERAIDAAQRLLQEQSREIVRLSGIRAQLLAVERDLVFRTGYGPTEHGAVIVSEVVEVVNELDVSVTAVEVLARLRCEVSLETVRWALRQADTEGRIRKYVDQSYVALTHSESGRTQNLVPGC
jgi:hypothetical protein